MLNNSIYKVSYKKHKQPLNDLSSANAFHLLTISAENSQEVCWSDILKTHNVIQNLTVLS